MAGKQTFTNKAFNIIRGVLLPVLISCPLLALEQKTPEWLTATFEDNISGDNTPIPDISDAYGVVFKDLTNDNLPDLYIVRFRNLNRLFVNRGNEKSFRDRTIRSGLGGNLSSRGEKNLELGATAVDYNNDGLQDILITGWDKTTRLFKNEGKFNFTDVTEIAGFELPVGGNCGVWADIDCDGDLDLFITSEHGPNQLYIQNKPGKFAECATEYGVAAEQISQGASFGDLDGDGYPDLYVCNWFAPDILYRNENGTAFKQINIAVLHLIEPLRSNGVWLGDYDNDADLDILVTDRDRRTHLYRNEISDEAWCFKDVTQISGLINELPCYSGIMADFDNNGWQDVYFTNIGPNRLFLNSGQGNYSLVYQEKFNSSSKLSHYSTGAAVADYDGDGALDLFVANKDTASILITNHLDNSNFIRIDVEGGISNRDGIGTKVGLWLETGENIVASLVGYREIAGGAGYLSAGENTVHFGVPQNSFYRVEVEFPSGRTVSRNNIISGQIIKISEHHPAVTKLFLTWKTIKRTLSTPEFWINFFLATLLIGLLFGYAFLAVSRYRWSPLQTIGFLVGTTVFLLICIIFLPQYGLRSVLWGQLALLLVVISIVTGFSERLYQLSFARYGYRNALKQFSDQLLQIHDNDELLQRLANVIHVNLRTEFCGLAIEKDEVFTVFAVEGDNKPELEAITLNASQRNALLRHSIITKSKIKAALGNTIPDSIEMMLSIHSKSLLALVFMGPREAGFEYKSQDHDILAILVRQAALAIDNNIYIDEMRQMTERVAEAEIRQKYIKELEDKNFELEKLFSDLKAAQAQLIQSEKMSSLGQLVAGIAHELNNPIGFIYSNLTELKKYLEILTKSDNQKELEFIRSDLDQLISDSLIGSERVRDIVSNLRNFSRLDEAEFKAADIHEGLESTLMLLNSELKDRITIQRNYGVFGPIDCLPGYLNQVFMNLLKNASDSISGRGNITIMTHRDNDFVEISISDDGCGIPAINIEKIFEPFFTTKPIGSGTGLGLSISYGIVERHRGTIKVESTVGKGSRFIIVLPVNQLGGNEC